MNGVFLVDIDIDMVKIDVKPEVNKVCSKKKKNDGQNEEKPWTKNVFY